MEDSKSNLFPYWRAVGSFLLDFITIFFVLGYVFATIFGGATESGFRLSGLPAVLLLALVIAYFIVFNRYLGGTLWRRILGVRPVS